MRKVFVMPLLLVLILPVLSGCWNQKELTDLAFVMAMGIDKGEDKKFEVSFQIVIPGNVSTGQNGGAQGLPIAVYTSSGDTLTEATRKATKVISRRLYYAHTNLIAVSEEIAKDGLLDILDALDREPEFRTTTELVVTRKIPAIVLVSALANLDKLPVNKITKEIDSTEMMLGENMSVNIDDFLSGLVSKGKEPIVNGFIVKGEPEMAGKSADLQHTKALAILGAGGLAVFKKGELTGWVENENARGVVWILDRVKGTSVHVDWNGKKDAITMAIIRSKTNVSVKFKNGKPVIHVAIEDEGWISEANTAVDLMNPKDIEKIDRQVEIEIKQQILASVKEAQKMKSDIFGFGERVHRKNPKYWNKVKRNWGEYFANLEVKVKVDSYIRREGIRTKPFWSDFNQ
ncbi:germination protein, Ger(x)C family [Neobacillus bataviensis LMG 21833]|uniref:Germination protein, Ger(X)C family n=1 Tax=Neobacillus bataviensis LMG 21833 TaxID=1117379 RepID=K6C3J0_9BACI|nr:Ger(x)C family spore germination protein [Neobacillus bataviensis]EKN65710.1 germination protein, Ger(x)C family [Neobacillus bataviensis LMG 21833]